MEARGSKKRKMVVGVENEEDEKVEEFFALIRSTREVRDRLRSKDHDRDHPVDINRKESSVWNPTFRPEDFTDDQDHRDDVNKPCVGGSSHGQSPPPKMEVESEKLGQPEKASVTNDNTNNKDNSLELDLKLSL